MLTRTVAAAGLLACCAGQALAFPIGQLSDHFTGVPFNGPLSRPAIATSPRGDSAVTWAANGDDGTLDIFLSLPTTGGPQGSVMGPPVRVNTSTYGHQRNPSIAMDATGDFVVVWQSETEPGDPSPQVIHAQRFSTGGFPVGPEFKVNLRVTQTHTDPQVAMDAAGNFVVAWLQTGVSTEVRTMIFTADGEIVRHGFFATDTAAHPPAIAMGAHGEYVIAWQQANGELAMKRVPADHDTNAAYVAVAPGAIQQKFPSVGVDAHGRFVIAWHEADLSGAINIRARRFRADGPALGEAFVVNEAYPIEGDNAPKVAMDASGDFGIAWDGAEYAGGLRDWYIQFFSQDGTRVSPETNGASFTTTTLPAVAVDADGDAFVAAIDGFAGQETVGVYRFTGPESIDLGINLADDLDPANPGDIVNFSFDVTNHHEPSSETGIAEIDSAIGFVDGFTVRLYFNEFTPHAEALPAQCTPGSYSDVYCRLGQLTPGESTAATTVPAQAHLTAGLAQSYAFIFAAQFDDGTAPDEAMETTSICEAGNWPGAIVISNAPASIPEGETASVEISRVGGTCGAVSVRYQPTNAAEGIVSWEDGADGVRTVPVTVDRDTIDQSAGWVGLTLTETTGGAVLNDPWSVTIEGEDTDPTPIVWISRSDETGAEGSTVRVRLALSGLSTADITVPLEWSGTATLGDDFSAPTVVTIPAREVGLYVPITLLADGLSEGQETVVLNLGTPTNAVLTDATSHTLTIAPSACQGPAGQIVITMAPATVNEGESAVVFVQRVNGTCGAVSVQYESTAGPDNAHVSGTLTWADGEWAPFMVAIPAYADNIDEEAQPIELTLSSPTGATLGSPSSATIMIIDVSDPPRVYLSRTQDGGFSEGGVATFILTLSEPSEKDIILPFTISGTADAADYSVSEPSGQVHFPAGGGWNDLRKEVQISLLRDDTFEGYETETVTVTLGQPTNARLTETTSWTFDIHDLDYMPFVSIDAPDDIAQEGTSRSVTINAWPRSTSPITIPLGWSGAAVLGADFSAPTSVTIAPGAISTTFAVNALADSTDEADVEAAVLTLGAPTNAALGSGTGFVLSIQDIDPPPSISFAQAAQTTREGAGVQVTLVAELSVASTREVKVLLSASGTAARGSDWSTSNDWLVIPAGSRTASKTVQILNNGVIELDEQVTFTMGSFTNAVAGGTTAHTLTIQDNDPEALGIR